jgi:hypothetical protein
VGESKRCHNCGQPEADPMVVVNDSLPALAGKRFHAACFRDALAEAVAELEERGCVTVDPGDDVSPFDGPVFCPSCGAPRTYDRLSGAAAYYCACPGYGAGAP